MGGRRIYGSSGTELEDETNSTCLRDMVTQFMEESGASAEAEDLYTLTQTTEFANVTEDCQNIAQSQQEFEILKVCYTSNSKISCSICCPTELNLLAEIAKCLEIARKQQQQQPECLKKFVMCHLRSVGYDAAICKTRPKDNSRSFPSGNYDYLDVILKSTKSSRSVRLFVDLDFRTQFEIARPSGEYNALLGLLPKIYVGRGDTLQSIIKIMCQGVKNSLKRKGMHLPPWRKFKYMHSMWLGSYKRTTACNCEHDHVHGGYKSNIMITESSSVTELMGMGFKGISSRHVWNPIHAVGNVEVAEEYLNWGSPTAVLLCKPSAGKLIRSTLSCALVDAGLTYGPLKNSRATTTMADYSPLTLIQ
eukprot:PITA_28392